MASSSSSLGSVEVEKVGIAVSVGMVEEYRKGTEEGKFELLQSAVLKHGVESVALNRRLMKEKLCHVFSHDNSKWTATNQKASGRCWLFAGLNLYRSHAISAFALPKDFEFSQNFLFFYDKLERCNYFLESIAALADRPLDDRTVSFLLDRPIDDGGQWNMFVNIVKKWGLVPKDVFGETQSSEATRGFNRILVTKLRQGAQEIREAIVAGKPHGPVKEKNLQEVFRVLAMHLGTPPTSFTWPYKKSGDDGAFCRVIGSAETPVSESLTPQQFAAIVSPPDEFVCLVHDPRPSSPYGRSFTVEFLGNVVGGDRVKYLNVKMKDMKKLAADAIKRGECVWFGCDVGKQFSRGEGVWDKDLLQYEKVYDAEFNQNKVDRLLYHATSMTHAMMFVGLHTDAQDNVVRWKVENSWGTDRAVKGFYTMSDSWFDEHVFEIAVKKSDLSAELLQSLTEEPVVLPPWDPFGSLAL